MTLGQKIRKLRLDKKMTLQDVAGITGYSKALISRIENDSVSPSISSLIKIASALDTTLYELFAAVEGKGTEITRRKDRSSQVMAGGKIKVQELSGNGDERKLVAVIMTFEPGASAAEEKAKVHSGEEWWHVLKGKLVAAVGENTYELGEGDSIYLNSSVPHTWQNPAKGKATALVLVTPSSAGL